MRPFLQRTPGCFNLVARMRQRNRRSSPAADASVGKHLAASTDWQDLDEGVRMPSAFDEATIPSDNLPLPLPLDRMTLDG